MSWYKRVSEGILTETSQKKEAPDGLWVKCPSCRKPTHARELKEHHQVCPFCGYHHKLDGEGYFELLFDDRQYTEHFADLVAGDPLTFTDTKAYTDRLAATQKKTGLRDAVRTAEGQVAGQPLVVSAMDFAFIGGSMGSVVGEKIARGIELAMERHAPYMTIARSGGARMMEGALSLMQMAKTSARLGQLGQAGLPFFSLMTDPTTGGVTASFAMLGDVNLAEPGALIGFAGPRVIKETTGKDLPEGFQRAEFQLDHGFVDRIVARKDLKQEVATLIRHLWTPKKP